MATYIENQPVLFGGEVACGGGDELDYKQLVDVSDSTQFQMQLNDCGIDDLVENGSFDGATGWTLGANWTIASNQLCLDGAASPGQAVNSYNFDQDLYYKITVTVDSISDGGQIDVFLGVNLIGSITAIGEYEFWGFPLEVAGDAFLTFQSAVEGTEICISLVSAYDVLINNIVGIYSEDGTYVTSISYADNPDYFVIDDDTVTVTIFWAELSITSGCYYLCWLDACSNRQGQNYPFAASNCDFGDDLHSWTAGAYWSPSGGQAVGSSPALASIPDATIAQTNVFPFVGINYCVTIVVSSMTSGTLEIYFGTQLMQTIITAGTYNICGIPNTNSISMVLGASTEVSVNSICAQAFNSATISCDYTSNTFQVGDYSGQCTLLINMCNDSNSMGFNFGASLFSPRVRIEAKLRQSSYGSERQIYRDSSGKRRTIYFDGVKFMTLSTGLLPEYIHDFLRLLLGADKFYIDGVEYYVEDEEYNVTRDNSQDEMGDVSLIVAKNTQNVKNSNCASEEASCVISGSFLLQEGSEEFITQGTGDLIIING